MLVRHPLFALFWVGSAYASSNKCLSSNAIGTKSYNACCTGQSSGIETIKGVEFRYTCEQYALDSNGDYGTASTAATAADCAGQCAENPECVVSTWFATRKKCLSYSDMGFRPHSEKYWMTFVRTGKTTDEKGGTDGPNCEEKVTAATAQCKAEEAKACETEKAALEQKIRAECKKDAEEKCKGISHEQCREIETKCSSDKLAMGKELQDKCNVEKAALSAKCDEEKANKDKELQESQKKWEMAMTALKNTCDADKGAKEQCETELTALKISCAADKSAKEHCEKDKAELSKKHDEERDSKKKLEQENKDLISKFEEEKEAQEKASKEEKAKLEEENNKLKEIIAASGGGPGGPVKPDVLPSGPENSTTPCPHIHGKEYTVDGVTYQAFCGKMTRGRVINRNVDGGILLGSSPAIVMKVCSMEPTCQGIFCDNVGHCNIYIDYQFPPTEDLTGARNEQVYSLIPVQPRQNSANANALSASSVLAGNLFGGCPHTHKQKITIASHTFDFRCREARGGSSMSVGTGGIRYPSWCMAACAATPGCVGTSMGTSTCTYYSSLDNLDKLEETSERPLSQYWVARLTDQS
ncbi:hypothetical protein BDV26DRAFT_51374 [Aspergillus bertholletiae]|uniref:Apple domain-containing protein n=1 Tax=Aspergillus bertholletiae TaxID=1226010 RepID=A0A5N7AYI7_9EURO|nr:hypothetical protein BDV26DRAFT_51374 [Aspergillus bertholletiae]